MKELLSKKFWQDVKKTLEDAQINVPPPAPAVLIELPPENPPEPPAEPVKE